jgi:2-polyprenyl-6-hydroxyphenyl methylase/3-demethylubiquinone-9 3-methyltransferase
MPVDNTIYDLPGDQWWNEDAPLSAIRTALNPGRLEYLSRVLAERGIDPWDKRALDVGCGGGLLAEELAALGFRVTGVDPSIPSLEVARRHAADAGLEIEYLPGAGEALPLPDASFDVAVCCDVLEHVDDVERVVAEIGRVLRPDGLFVYDTINRTFASRLVVIELLQDWAWTRVMPRDLHSWDRFVTPAELIATMERHGLRSLGYTGLKPAANPVRLAGLLRRRRRREISAIELGRRAVVTLSADTSMLYIGHASKSSGHGPRS